MFEASQLLPFSTAVLVLVLVPGPDTAIILAHSVGFGRNAGFATVAGVELGTMIHISATALGLYALLAASPVVFGLVKIAGITYLVISGVRMLSGITSKLTSDGAAPLHLPAAFRRALLTNLLNPRVALFFLAFLPQFVRPERGRMTLQFAMLGLIVLLVGAGYGLSLVLVAGTVARGLNQNSVVGRWQRRITGGVLIGLALRLTLT